MIQTAENLALKYGIARADVDAFAATSFARAVAAQLAGWFDGEIVPVMNESFELAGYKARGIKLSAKATVAERDTHPRPTPVEVLAKLRSVFKDGVQTGGNVNGGAIALGHPLAATGVRLTITVARQLKEIGARWGVASACVGGGQGVALLIENPEHAENP